MPDFLRELPTYQCHKRVQALRIKKVIPNPRGFELHFTDERFAPHQVSSDWVWSHQPGAILGIPKHTNLEGGYFVIYADGYQSWSPATAFEAGYSLITSDASAAGPVG